MIRHLTVFWDARDCAERDGPLAVTDAIQAAVRSRTPWLSSGLAKRAIDHLHLPLVFNPNAQRLEIAQTEEAVMLESACGQGLGVD